MSILSKIILKEWFKSLVGSISILFLLITVGDIINGLMRSYEFSYILKNYFLKLPELAGKLLPVASLLSTLFSFNKLKNRSELMAILAGGLSTFKIYLIIFISSLIIALCQFVNLGIIQPKANKLKREQFEKSRRNESKYLARSQIGSSGLLWYKSADYFTSFETFNRKEEELKNITIYFQGKNGLFETILKADSAIYIKDGIWKLLKVKRISSLDMKNFPQIKVKESETLRLEEVPEDFGQFESDITTLDFFDLYKFIKRLDKTGINTVEYKTMLYDKLSLTLMCIVFSLIPLSIIFKPNRRASGFGKNIVFGLVFTIVFWLLQSALAALGSSNKIPPALAALTIPFLSLGYVFIVYRKNKHL